MLIRTFRSGHGFTLIELLIVVAIIAILAAIAVPNFLEAQTRSKVARCRSDMRTMATGLEAYSIDNNNKYPSEWLHISPDGVREQRAQGHLTTPIAYLTSILLDPFKSQAKWGDQGYYRYYNYHERYKTLIDFSTFIDPNSNPKGSNAPWFSGPTAWVLFSFGPDMDTSYRTTPPMMVPYEASNGTISFGDMFRFGPGGQSS